MGPASRGTPTLTPASPRPGGQAATRPTSELLGTGAMSFQTPEGMWRATIDTLDDQLIAYSYRSGGVGPMVRELAKL